MEKIPEYFLRFEKNGNINHVSFQFFLLFPEVFVIFRSQTDRPKTKINVFCDQLTFVAVKINLNMSNL